MYMKIINGGCVDMKETFFIKNSSERRKIADSSLSCGKFMLLKDFIGLWFDPKGKNPMPNKDFFDMIFRFGCWTRFFLKETFYAVILFNVPSG